MKVLISKDVFEESKDDRGRLELNFLVYLITIKQSYELLIDDSEVLSSEFVRGLNDNETRILNWDKLKSVGGFKLPKNYSQQVFLLDGYQRLSSLFGCLTNAQKANLEIDETIDRDSLYNLYFDLEEENFVYLRYTPKPYQVPVHILMSTSDFRQYSRKYIEPYCKDEQLDMYLDRADAFSRTLIDYKLAVVEISEASLSDAVNIFPA